MSMRAGVGRSDHKDSYAAGAAAARAALDQAGLARCDFVFMFATVGFNQEELLKGVRSVTGDARLSGCSGEGVISQAGPEGEVVFTTSGPKAGTDVIGVMTVASDEIIFTNFIAGGLKADSRRAGAAIGSAVKQSRQPHPLLLWMAPDGQKANIKEFFEGVDASLPEPLPYLGPLAGDDFILGRTYQYHNDRVLSDSAACVLLSGNGSVEIGVTHGCVPIGLEKTVTKARGSTVYEVEHLTAWDFFKQYLDEKWTKFTREIRTFLDFGIKLPESLATEYDRYIIRAPLAQNPDNSMTFATEIKEGTKLQVIRRDADKTSLGARAMAERIKANLHGRKPVAVLHVDCAARGRMFFGEDVKAKGIDVMQEVLGKDIPWLGMYACGEIAPIKGANYFHNQTAVLCVLCRKG